MSCNLHVSMHSLKPFKFTNMFVSFDRVLRLFRVHTDAWVGSAQFIPAEHGQRGSCGRTPRTPAHADVSPHKPDRQESQV